MLQNILQTIAQASLIPRQGSFIWQLHEKEMMEWEAAAATNQVLIMCGVFHLICFGFGLLIDLNWCFSHCFKTLHQSKLTSEHLTCSLEWPNELIHKANGQTNGFHHLIWTFERRKNSLLSVKFIHRDDVFTCDRRLSNERQIYFCTHSRYKIAINVHNITQLKWTIRENRRRSKRNRCS